MNWQPKTLYTQLANFEDLKPTEVLYEFDGPRIFLANTLLGQLLCYFLDENEQIQRFIVAPTNAHIIEKLKTGLLCVHDALNQPWVWFIDLDNNGNTIKAWQGVLSEAPSIMLPKVGVMLWPDLEPVFALRAIGEGLAEGTVPMSVIRQVIDGASTSLKKVSKLILDKEPSLGRTTNSMRQFYDLSAIGFAYNSFEISFKLPSTQQDLLSEDASKEIEATFKEMSGLLENSLQWAIEECKEISEQETEPLSIELLEALDKLVPPQTGIIKEIEVRGRLFSTPYKKFELTRQASVFVRKNLTKVRAAQEKITTTSGLVRQFDKDDLTFTLRETTDGKEHLCSFQQEYYDILYEVFDKDIPITVSGMENLKTHKIEVYLVSLAEI